VKAIPTRFPRRWFQFTPDETHVLAGQEFAGECQLLTMVDIDSGRQLWSRSGPSGGPITFSPDGRRFLLAWARRSPRLTVLWDAADGEVLCVVLTPLRSDLQSVFGRDGTSVHLGTSDGLRLWPGEREGLE